ncbi:hypothetical protein E1B28_001814 [Marasmius oreades]|uniref:Uncharacterized protein n=1 Tax=Marasmius oreades TaxID=181124 RepID=A0A9P7V487_9AGAR|nr:uncharacterized protein E1B28_001814 [Marasmius oreades]KAG7100028.1 hypothetical protein E1B28_001814 [Marasmius oreades]
MSSLSVTALPETDAWRKPPSTNLFNAPTHPLTSPVPLKSFQRARLTVSAAWTTRYDQGGLLLHVTNPSKPNDYWLKTGIEFYMDRPNVSTVGTQTWSDWSIFPTDSGKATVEVRREGDGLWVYQIVKGEGVDEERKPLREIAWFFAEEDGWSVDIKAMAARPAKADEVIGSKELVVEFDGVEIDVQADLGQED